MTTPDTTERLSNRELVGTLPPQLQAAVELHRMQRAVQAQLGAQNWGKGLDRTTQLALADYATRFGLDPATEIDVLGGKLYRNAAYYLRKLAELQQEPDHPVQYAYPDHVAVDARLEKMAKGTDELAVKAKAEIARREWERIEHAIPEVAAAAVVFRVKLKYTDREIAMGSWCGGGSRKSDPVGDAEPAKTAESRAARRAMRMVVSHVPAHLRFGSQFQMEDAAWTVAAGKAADALEEDGRLAEGQSGFIPIEGAGAPLRIKGGGGGEVATARVPADQYGGVGPTGPVDPLLPLEDPLAEDRAIVAEDKRRGRA